MPAFVTNGPDIPDHLLQAHEDSHVVFFCGAGISYPAGLPDFCGLVDRIYTELGTQKEANEEQAYENKQYDKVLDQLERRYPGQRLAVRTALSKVLKPNFRKKGATTTHQALLRLAKDHKGKVRLVTTNFDRIFHYVIKRHKLDIPSFEAPLLPIPKPTRWHGVVHLHGLLPDKLDEIALNRLVLTSGDFGLAYLVERWAARFVSELFRNYTVCFVGYSIEDPVLRYMMDALAADELIGENRREAYAFASYHDGKREETQIKWQNKGVTPLLYKVTAGTHDHSALHLTLKEWADTYRDGVQGKKMIIAKHASTPPLTSSRSDFAVGRVLWALTDELVAKHFADLNPVPLLEWLEPLAKAQFGHDDLACFGVVPKSEKDKNLSFSFINRPSPYTHSPWMHIANTGAQASSWDGPMFHLARWLTLHLNDPKLILWLSKQSGKLQERFIWLVRDRIKYLDQLARKGDLAELERIQEKAPKAIPDRFMRILWRLLLSGRVKSPQINSDLFDWFSQFEQDGLTPTLRMELRRLLRPLVILREPFHWGEGLAGSRTPERIKDLVDWDIVLWSDHTHSILRDQTKKPGWQEALPELLKDFILLLHDALDLMRELGGAEDIRDLSYIHQPSISEHKQNRSFPDWTVLIELTRDAWVATVQTNPAQAGYAAEGWWQVPYPLFKRLAFFAATQGDIITLPNALNWLLADDQWWLWSIETQREAIRLLVALTPKLDEPGISELEQAVLKGPPREMYKNDIDPQDWLRIVDRGIWLRLAKMHATGKVLGHNASTKLDELARQYPHWQLAEEERDEFRYWMSEGDEWREIVHIPLKSDELVGWLKEHPRLYHLHEDDWSMRCRDDFQTIAEALSALAKEKEWPIERWGEALQVWSEDKLIKESWFMAQVIEKAPDNVIQTLSHSLSRWLQAQAKIFESNEVVFFALIQRILELELQNEVIEDDDLVLQAINHPIGLVTEALLRWWYRQELKDAEGLIDEVKPLFTKLCDTTAVKFRHGRVLLAAHVITLFRVDEKWARKYLLPLFDWQSSEALAAWEGFLWSPRLYRPLLSAIKQPLLETVIHYEKLGKYAEQYAEFLTFVALDGGDTFTTEELAEATSKLPVGGLQRAAHALIRALEGAGEQRGEYWRNRVLPYLKSVWPKTRDVMTPEISEALGWLCIVAKDAFPEALEELHHWLQPVEHPFYLIHLLNEAKLCEQFASDALVFLDAIINDQAQLLPELKQCLDDIEKADKSLTKKPSFIRLTQLVERSGIS